MCRRQRYLKLNRKKEIEDLLSSLSEEDFNTIKKILSRPKSPATPTPPKKRRGRGKRKRRKKELPSSSNDFMNGVSLSPAESEELKEATDFDKSVGVQQPRKRQGTGRKSSKIKVKCRVCSKEELIYPSYLPLEPSRYKCNKCACSAG
jgi:hypothetical protein